MGARRESGPAEAHDRARQGVDHWAQHGVEEMTQREAAERAELGEVDEDESEQRR